MGWQWPFTHCSVAQLMPFTSTGYALSVKLRALFVCHCAGHVLFCHVMQWFSCMFTMCVDHAC